MPKVDPAGQHSWFYQKHPPYCKYSDEFTKIYGTWHHKILFMVPGTVDYL